MSTIVEIGSLKLLLKRINNFNTNHNEGWINIPNMCVKVKHGNGFAWFGINILDYENITWSNKDREAAGKAITEALGMLTDLEYIASDINRTLDSILEIINEKKTNLLLSNITPKEHNLDSYILRNEKNNHKDQIVAMNLTNGVSLELYKDTIDPDSLSYGGFALEITTHKGKFPAILYHRAIILNNYIESEQAEDIVKYALEGYFNELFNVKLNVRVIQIVQRNRQ